MYTYLYMYVCLCACVCCINIHLYLHIYMCIYIYICIYMYISIYVYIYLYINVCLCACVCLFVSRCMCLFVCVCVCVCSQILTAEQFATHQVLFSQKHCQNMALFLRDLALFWKKQQRIVHMRVYKTECYKLSKSNCSLSRSLFLSVSLFVCL